MSSEVEKVEVQQEQQQHPHQNGAENNATTTVIVGTEEGGGGDGGGSGGKGKVRKPFRQVLQHNWQIVIKIVELILCVTCLCFVYEPAKVTGLGSSHMHYVGIMYTAYTGYILILTAFLLGRYMGDRLPYKTNMIFSISGAALFLITAILLISTKSHLTRSQVFHPNAYLMVMMMTSVVFAFINVLVFAIDAILTFRRQEQL